MKREKLGTFLTREEFEPMKRFCLFGLFAAIMLPIRPAFEQIRLRRVVFFSGKMPVSRGKQSKHCTKPWLVVGQLQQHYTISQLADDSLRTD